MKKLLFLFLVVILGSVQVSQAQTPMWAFKIGSTTNDVSYTTKVAPNGNVVIAGKFTGVMDLDPNAGVFNVTSNGQEDIFVACYASTGLFLWGGSIGGGDYDAAKKLTIDAANNVIICGYYRGAGVDFDPGAGTFTLSDAGLTGSGSINFDGEGFVAKFSSTGVFQWAKSLGAETVYDCTFNVTTDPQLNVYACGFFTGTMVVSPTITWNSTTTGKCYIIKYNPTGTVIWGDVFGLPGYASDDCVPLSIEVKNNKIYNSGVLQGTADLDPGVGVANFTAVGLYDAYLAKFDTAGNYINAIAISGTGSLDQGNNLITGPLGSVFVSGFTNSPSLTFNSATGPSGNAVNPTGGGSNDFFIARYDTNLNYVWGQITGGPGADACNDIGISNNYLYATGSFNGSVDFNPGAATFSLASTGANDIFVSKYDLNDNFVCAFKVGGSAADEGNGMGFTPTGDVYLTGTFTGLTVDFDPGPSLYTQTSNGGSDVFLIKYGFTDQSVSGFISGDTICPGEQAYITLHIGSGGAGPYSVTLSDGTTTNTYTGVMSNVPFALTPSPVVNTTYSVFAISYTGSNACLPLLAAAFGSTRVITASTSVNIIATPTSCNTVTFLSSTSDSAYAWSFGDGGTSTNASSAHIFADTGTYTVILNVADTTGCFAADTLFYTLAPPPVVTLNNDTIFCFGNSIVLQSSVTYPAGTTYTWSTGSGAPTITVGSTGNYWLRVTKAACSRTDTVHVIVNPLPVVNLGNDTSFCVGQTVTFSSPQPAGNTYIWSDGSTGSSLGISASGTYWLRVNVSTGCTAIDSIHITTSPAPYVNMGPDTTSCFGGAVLLQGNGTYVAPVYQWSTGATTPSTITAVNGIYWLDITDGGCTTRDSISVTIRFDTLRLENRDTAICKGQVLQTFGGANPGASIQWVPTAGIGASTFINTTIMPDTSAMYYLEVNLPGCPTLYDSFFLDVQPVPRVFGGGSRVICAHDTVHLKPTVLPAWYSNYSYAWTPVTDLDQSTTATVVFTAGPSTTYTVTVTTPAGCTGVDSIKILVRPGDFGSIIGNQNKCPGDSVLLNAAGGVSYQWFPAMNISDPTSPTPWAYPVADEDYHVIVTSVYGCTDTLAMHIGVYPAALITLSDSVVLYPGESYQLSAVGNCTSFNWFPPEGLDTFNISNPTATPPFDTRYIVFGSTENGCQTSDTISIYLSTEAIIAMPNAFTPGTGVNNYFHPINKGLSSINYFRVYDRWGVMVFETTSLNSPGWDGNYKAVPQGFGVYMYDIQGVSLTGQIVKRHGNVTLLR
ncbi:hypothetical protein CJD36_006290 [Flavipsychrobacter stenotrophus]|uniref:PKD domain-containing protein n=1 Tax=Flavipsychrobacter stenotrophus TaxID=2077091 RepID=A0A2S7SXH0_9BACT|nr:PKD domain-containing protein [Flavipsychrobacter stenotrophus]PQJ11408.1 hypothetical protein CJD36_006290 [Flavipsychrobacter stenotrophus]